MSTDPTTAALLAVADQLDATLDGGAEWWRLWHVANAAASALLRLRQARAALADGRHFDAYNLAGMAGVRTFPAFGPSGGGPTPVDRLRDAVQREVRDLSTRAAAHWGGLRPVWCHESRCSPGYSETPPPADPELDALSARLRVVLDVTQARDPYLAAPAATPAT